MHYEHNVFARKYANVMLFYKFCENIFRSDKRSAIYVRDASISVCRSPVTPPLLLPNLNEKWKVQTKFSKTRQYKIS